MQSPAQTPAVSNQTLWAGRIVSALTIAFLLFDSSLKVMKLAPAVEATARLGYPPGLVRPLGIVELVCLAVFLIPRASTLGAILLTGYLGGATATQVRLEDPHRLFNAGLEAKESRAIDIHEGDRIDEPGLKDLVRAAVALNRGKPRSKKPAR